MPDYQKDYVALVEKYRKGLAKADASVIPASDKAKLLKLLADMAAGLKVAGQTEKFTDENNKLVTALTKVANDFKKFNTDAKKVGKELDTGITAANSARSLASQQKGFDKSKDFKDMDEKMRDVSDWLDICKPKEMKLTDFAAAL